MKYKVIKNVFAATFILLASVIATAQNKSESNVISLNESEFQAKVFNFKKHKNWKFEGKKPAIIDFYADWCGPCRRLAPIVSELANNYKGKIDVYKVDVDAEKQLAVYFKISSIPVLMFIPASGEPKMITGLRSKSDYEKIIADFLLVK